MTTVKPNKYWTPVIIILLAIIVIGGIVAWSKYRGSQPIEISLPPSQELQSEIYIGGAVNNPGFYSLKAGDSIEALIQAAGGIIDSADFSQLRLYIPQSGEEQQPQKIDLNQAEAWLLQALPGIGEDRAKAIIDYRQQNKRFHNIDELTKVEGIGVTTYERIKNLITVAD
jgi:competence protein ComEA